MPFLLQNALGDQWLTQLEREAQPSVPFLTAECFGDQWLTELECEAQLWAPFLLQNALVTSG